MLHSLVLKSNYLKYIFLSNAMFLTCKIALTLFINKLKKIKTQLKNTSYKEFWYKNQEHKASTKYEILI